jgi:hypothetical protein
LGEKGSPTVRARVFGFVKLDGSVACEEHAIFDRTWAKTSAIGTSVWLLDGARLLGGGLFTELPSDSLAGLVGALFDGGEIEAVQGFVGTEEIRGNRFQDWLEARVEVGLRR